MKEYVNWFSDKTLSKISCICCSIRALKIMTMAVSSNFNNTELEIIFPELFNKIPFVTVVDNDTTAVNSAYNINIDWADRTKIKIRTGLASFTLLAIG